MIISVEMSRQDRIVMEVLWDKGEVTTMEVLEELGTEEWSRFTVRTYLLRLVEKKLAAVKKISRKNQFYYPLISKEEYLAKETRAYLNERYSGFANVVAGLALNNKISEDELNEIERFIKDYKNKDK